MVKLVADYVSYAISRTDTDIGILIDNCLGFLYSVNHDADTVEKIRSIESTLFEMVYMGRTPEAKSSKERLFRKQIMPIMKDLAPKGYYFGTNPDDNGLLGFWKEKQAG